MASWYVDNKLTTPLVDEVSINCKKKRRVYTYEQYKIKTHVDVVFPKISTISWNIVDVILNVIGNPYACLTLNYGIL